MYNNNYYNYNYYYYYYVLLLRLRSHFGSRLVALTAPAIMPRDVRPRWCGSWMEKGAIKQDNTIAVLADFAVQVLHASSSHFGRPVTSINDAMIMSKGALSRKLTNKIQKVNVAYAVCRHISKEYCDELLDDMKAQLAPKSSRNAENHTVSPDGIEDAKTKIDKGQLSISESFARAAARRKAEDPLDILQLLQHSAPAQQGVMGAVLVPTSETDVDTNDAWDGESLVASRLVARAAVDSTITDVKKYCKLAEVEAPHVF